MKKSFVVAVPMILSLIAVAHASKEEICNQKGGIHKAIYICPDGYEITVSGHGTHVCRGGCFPEGNRRAFKLLLDEMISMAVGKKTSFSDDEATKIYDILHRQKTYIIKIEQYEIPITLK